MRVHVIAFFAAASLLGTAALGQVADPGPGPETSPEAMPLALPGVGGETPAMPRADADGADAAADEPVEISDEAFSLMIEAQRWGVILERAEAGLAYLPDEGGEGVDEDISLTIDRALKRGAAHLLRLRADMCGEGAGGGPARCDPVDWPPWVLETPRAGTPLNDLAGRSEWLSEAMTEITAAGCNAGRAATGDDLFCSVE